MGRPSSHFAAAVWLVHGLLDGLLTVAAVALLESTTVESNPLLRPHLHAALAEYQHVYYPTWGSYLSVFWKPLLLKLVVVGAAAALLCVVARAVPRRAFVAFSSVLTAAGIVIVLNNLLALRGLLA